jgi:hypothetical protein
LTEYKRAARQVINCERPEARRIEELVKCLKKKPGGFYWVRRLLELVCRTPATTRSFGPTGCSWRGWQRHRRRRRRPRGRIGGRRRLRSRCGWSAPSRPRPLRPERLWVIAVDVVGVHREPQPVIVRNAGRLSSDPRLDAPSSDNNWHTKRVPYGAPWR